ncbi:MAG: serine hydroxymethyltransferase [Candidatus Binatus sp.]|uniref:serine hydroxymethyltransferase n=1 Tax=Candidatus Binatus sp. TaxID=2811406 RepID=UPI003CA01DBB
MDELKRTDPQIYQLIRDEERYEIDSVRLIPSENYVSKAVLEATGSILTNKYSEGYPGRRYYEGQRYVDQIETIAIDRAKALFKVDHANVQPYSGSPANLAVYFALLKPGDTIMGLSLPHGGHLTHGWPASITGTFWRSAQYLVDRESHLLDFDKIREMARKERPRIIVTGGTAYPRLWDFKSFSEIAKEAGALLLADISHIAGLIVGGVHPDPAPYADVITTTTHKTLRGPRGAMILCRKEYAEAIDKAIIPGLQGGPHNHTTAAIAVALKEASTPEFKAYAKKVVSNAKTLADELLARGFTLISGGTDNHLILIDLTSKKIIGKKGAKALDAAGIVCNSNTIPYDPRKPFSPSGIRLGTPAVTSRGMGDAEMRQIGKWIDQAIAQASDEAALKRIAAEVTEMCRSFPAPGITLS